MTRTNGDVYVAMRDGADSFKASLHASGECRVAFSRDLAMELALDQRVSAAWSVDRGAAAASRTAYTVIIPTAELRTIPVRRDEQSAVLWLDARPAPAAVEVAVGFAPAVESDRLRAELVAEAQLLAMWASGNGDICWVIGRANAFVHAELAASLKAVKKRLAAQPPTVKLGTIDLKSESLRVALGFVTSLGQRGMIELSSSELCCLTTHCS